MPKENQDISDPHQLQFVWWSTDASVRDAVPSILAIAEVIIAVCAYWGIAIYFNTSTHLWISICIAPLLLLRSDQSTALGIKLFEDFAKSLTDGPTLPVAIRSFSFWIVASIALIITAIISILLFTYWATSYEGWGHFFLRIVDCNSHAANICVSIFSVWIC